MLEMQGGKDSKGEKEIWKEATVTRRKAEKRE